MNSGGRLLGMSVEWPINNMPHSNPMGKPRPSMISEYYKSHTPNRSVLKFNKFRGNSIDKDKSGVSSSGTNMC